MKKPFIEPAESIVSRMLEYEERDIDIIREVMEKHKISAEDSMNILREVPYRKFDRMLFGIACAGTAVCAFGLAYLVMISLDAIFSDETAFMFQMGLMPFSALFGGGFFWRFMRQYANGKNKRI